MEVVIIKKVSGIASDRSPEKRHTCRRKRHQYSRRKIATSGAMVDYPTQQQRLIKSFRLSHSFIFSIVEKPNLSWIWSSYSHIYILKYYLPSNANGRSLDKSWFHACFYMFFILFFIMLQALGPQFHHNQTCGYCQPLIAPSNLENHSQMRLLGYPKPLKLIQLLPFNCLHKNIGSILNPIQQSTRWFYIHSSPSKRTKTLQ